MDFITQELNRREVAEQKWLDRLPKCCECGNPIQDEKLFNIHGDFYCEECMEYFKEYTEGYINE